MPLVIAIVASGRGQGKTALVELLCHTLSKELIVWTVKHASNSFDIEDKDTWRHMEAGASGTIAVSPRQVVVLKSRKDASLEEALGEIPRGVDLVLIEGFRGSTYPKVLVAKTVDEAKKQLQEIEGVFAAFVGTEETGSNKVLGSIPVLSGEELAKNLREMVARDQVKRLPGLNCKKCGYPSCEALTEAIVNGSASLRQCRVLEESDLQLLVDGNQIFLSQFPKSFVKNVLLAMVESLKGVDHNSMAKISIELRI
jgi:molybdopterin-guanine dinucleotide biosynthesis protein B